MFASYLVLVFIQVCHSKPLNNTNLFMQLANVMGRSQWLTCPRKVIISDEYYSLKEQKCPSSDMLNFVRQFMQDLSTGWLHCDPGPLFKPEYYDLTGWVPRWVSK